MNQPFRLADGGRIDRTRPLAFRFDGRELQGFDGDTLASALLANGVRVVARSFKYHRPRGITSAGEEEPTGFVEVGSGAAREPNCRAPLVPLTAGLEARSQGGWPGLRFDLARLIDTTHPLWPAGFYNKTFKWPRWQTWEGLVRSMTGFGRAPKAPDPDHYEQVNAHCDLLICGGGPAGLTAALCAARAGARVILAEQDREFGGSLNAERTRLDGEPASAWVARVIAELESLPGVALLPATTVTGLYDHNLATLLQRGAGTAWRECWWTVRPRFVLLATGAIEQGLVFPGNDRPGTMLAASVRHYLNRYAVAAGRTAVIATNNDSAYQTVFDLAGAGIEIAAVADLRAEVGAGIRQRLDALGVRLWAGARIASTRGHSRLSRVCIESLDGRALARQRCDLLAVSGGWSPRLHLHCHARGTLRFDAGAQSFVADRLPRGVSIAGAVGGCWSLSDAFSGAEAAARARCAELGLSAPPLQHPHADALPPEPGETLLLPPRATRRRQWIDLAHDVTFHDAELAVREGFVSVEHFKRYTTAGMSIDQGKTGNLNAFHALAALTGRPVAEIGTTTFRPPYTPVTLGAVAGRRGGDTYPPPRRHLPAHLLHEGLGARLGDFGGWQRPECYPRQGESREATVRREVLAVRRGVGVFDGSPLGKIEVFGPDAAEFLNRCYISDVAGLAVGRCRYGLMLNENGVIIDDGVFSRFAADRFLVNTTSAGAARIASLLDERRQCDWPDLRVVLASVAAQWACFTVAGPHARALLESLDRGIAGACALPHMSIAETRWQGAPMRILRVSYSGEASYELNVPANFATALLQALLDTGRRFGIEPYGIDALDRLRLEKGFFHVGTDTDGQTTPDDVGWGRVARGKQADYIGRRSLFRPASLDARRRQLVGIEVPAGAAPLAAGSHLLSGSGRRAPAPTEGWITTSGYSPTLERPIALAMLSAGRSRLGSTVTVIDGDECREARVVAPAFYDSANGRLRT